MGTYSSTYRTPLAKAKDHAADATRWAPDSQEGNPADTAALTAIAYGLIALVGAVEDLTNTAERLNRRA